MTRSLRTLTGLVLLLALVPLAHADTGLQSITVLFSETWTGNAYRQPYFDVTGSEASPIDLSVGGGVRINLVDPFLFQAGALTIDPRFALGARRYLLYPSGRVVPTQLETSLGATETLEPGLGSARVLTLSLIVPIGLEIELAEGAALTVGLSPTMLFRLRAGDADYLNEKSDLNGMYSFFYGRLRWLRPEFHVAGRFRVSDALSFAIRTTASLSMLDLSDATLPWWDQLKIGAAFELSASAPFAAVFRNSED